MLNNDQYNKIKILQTLSCLAWFIKKHAEQDAEKSNDASCIAFYDELTADLEKHIKKLQNLICK